MRRSLEEQLASWERVRLEPEESDQESDDLSYPDVDCDSYDDTRFLDDYYEDCRNSFVNPRF